MAFQVKRGDAAPPFSQVLRDSAKRPVNLAGATVRFVMAPLWAGEPVKVDSPATVVDAASGAVEYRWQTADLSTVGRYRAELRVTLPEGKRRSFPPGDYYRIEVWDDLD